MSEPKLYIEMGALREWCNVKNEEAKGDFLGAEDAFKNGYRAALQELGTAINELFPDLLSGGKEREN